MSVRITSIADRGDAQKERIVMKVSRDSDIGEYVILRTLFDGTYVTTDVTDVYWFPDAPVKAGDYVVLYSKAGANKQRVRDEGRTSHFYYWGHKSALWGTRDHSAVLIHADRWHSLNPSK